MEHEIELRAWIPASKEQLKIHPKKGMMFYQGHQYYSSFFRRVCMLASGHAHESYAKKKFKLMLWTGFRDKHHDKIFPHDILQFKNHIDTIELGLSKDGYYGFIWSKTKNLVSEGDDLSERYEIIGNTFEHSHLLP